jgi:hypothetical protein
VFTSLRFEICVLAIVYSIAVQEEKTALV